MSRGAHRDQRQPIRDLGKRSIHRLNTNDTLGVSLPAQLKDTNFLTEFGSEVRVQYDPVENEVRLKPASGD